MPKFLVEGRYTPEGLRALAHEKPSSRQAVLKETFASVGGKLEAVYYALGGTDVYVVFECPDHVSAAAVSLAASSTGMIRTKTIPLLTIEEADRAISTKTSYRAPGVKK
jgi:uncharacterized protein with GYD domain